MEIRQIFSPTLLKNTVTVLTGAGRGLGKSLALGMAQTGTDLVLVARHPDQIEATAKEVRQFGVRALPVQADLTREEDICRMVEIAMNEFGQIDALVNNAGLNAGYVSYNFESIPANEWEGMMRLNVNGLFMVTKAVGNHMLARGSGKVINIASGMAVKATPGKLCYSVTKAAVIQMTRALAVEWAGRGITVNCVAPGSLDLFPGCSDPGHVELNERRKERIPMRRIGSLEDVTPAVVYLASPAADYITGATMFIDGGMAI